SLPCVVGRRLSPGCYSVCPIRTHRLTLTTKVVGGPWSPSGHPKCFRFRPSARVPPQWGCGWRSALPECFPVQNPKVHRSRCGPQPEGHEGPRTVEMGHTLLGLGGPYRLAASSQPFSSG